ncbi:MAG: hypothetical protein Q9M32_07785 [Sulfurimonas sp.]|nr:hypothetical protein [Sulfurimonas sp.]MDQ7061697.1 hypothetical protein [Sulfurimonas sp.]
MLKKITLLLLLQSILFSNDFEVDLDAKFYEFRFHGNFCGANLPAINTKTKEEEKQLLQRIVPIDLIDQACKEHDICYLQTGTKHSVCDQRLVLNLKKTHNKLEDRSCRRLSKSISYFFTIKTENPITVTQSDDDIADKFFTMPAVAFTNMMDSASMSSVVAINYGYRKPVGYLFDSDNNSQRRKELLQIFPPRFKVCKVKE